MKREALPLALSAYAAWLQTPVRTLVWGESDRAAVGMELVSNGALVIDLERYVGEEGEDSTVALHFAFSLHPTPGLHDYRDTSTTQKPYFVKTKDTLHLDLRAYTTGEPRLTYDTIFCKPIAPLRQLTPDEEGIGPKASCSRRSRASRSAQAEQALRRLIAAEASRPQPTPVAEAMTVDRATAALPSCLHPM